MMHERVDDGGGGHLVRENLGPLFERQVRRKDDAAMLVTLGDDWKSKFVASGWNGI